MLCIVLAMLFAVVATMATWIRMQALDTDEWVDSSLALLDRQVVTDALAVYLVDEISEALGLEGTPTSTVDGDDVADDITGARSQFLRQPVIEAAERLLRSERFRATWTAANRTAHQTIVAVLRDETRPGFAATAGTVTLDLGVLVRALAADIGLPQVLIDRLPDGTGSVTLVESDRLRTAQTGVRILDFVSWFAVGAAVAFAALGMFVARDRVRALRDVGLGLVGAGVFVLVARAVATRVALGALVEDPRAEPVADIAAEVMTGLLREIALGVVVVGLVIVVSAVLPRLRRAIVEGRA